MNLRARFWASTIAIGLVSSTTLAKGPLPSISLTADPLSVDFNAGSTLKWSSKNSSSCSASGGWSGIQPASGSTTIPALVASTNFAMKCSNANGSATQSVTVTVHPSSETVGSVMGINLSWVNDWGDHQLTFVDVVKQARGFASLQKPWDPANNPVPLDANGWPTTDFGVFFITTPADPLKRPLTTTYPSMFGTYHLSFAGQAKISSLGGSQIVNQIYDAPTNTTTAEVVVGPAQTQVDLEFADTHSGVQNLRFLRPGYATDTTQVFTDEFIRAVAPFGTLRFMELLRTNDNPVTSWKGRKLPDDPIQNDPRGVAWEYVIQLANTAHKDIWINIPAGVDLTDMSGNNYVRRLASLLKKNLNPDLRVYVEYSNELWNTAFPQSAANTGAAESEVNTGADPSLNYDKINNKWYWGYRRAAHQIVRISQLFAGVYGPDEINKTIRPVYVSQEVQPYLTEDSLAYIQNNFGPPSRFIYAVGGAPYFYASANDATLDEVFTALETGLNKNLPGFSGLPAYNGGKVYTEITFQSLANYYGLKRVAYEGGPDLSAQQNAALAEQAIGDGRMNHLVQAQLADFYGCGNTMFVYYKLAAPPAKGSVFGAYEDITVPTEISRALMTVAATPLKHYAVCTPKVTDELLIQ